METIKEQINHVASPLSKGKSIMIAENSKKPTNPQNLSLSNVVKKLPHTPGVYIYRNTNHVPIYIGKAIDLSRRVRQYFERNDAVGDKTPKLVSEIASLETIETSSEFEALLLEAKLIKEHQPKYNVIAKDDKSPLYIAITIADELPKVFFTRKPTIKDSQLTTHNTQPNSLYFGPFQSARVARALLRSIRRIIPYCTQKERTGKKCFYTHLKLCNPCPSYISKLQEGEERKRLTRQYRQHMFRLRDILSGTAMTILDEMNKEMETLSKQQKYEEALEIRNQIEALRTLLQKRYDPTIYVQSDTMLTELIDRECRDLLHILSAYYPNLTKLHRIECFDISNTMGTNAVASMVVATDGKINNSEYRKFRMRTKAAPNDFAMMYEALTRRFNHPEWEFPDLLLIDGGKGQVTSALKALSDSGIIIPVIGLAKREEEIVVPIGESSTQNTHLGPSDWKILRLPFSSAALKLVTRIRDEAHRFAITYHKKLRKKALITV